ncbi:MAG TPA: hypothetical protein VHD59_06540 [Pseudolabrys sp.]|nr:hypothetical protein [Pseudolabrys sp.]
MTNERQRFFLEDIITGECRDLVLEAGATEQDARDRLGGSWTERARVACHGPQPAGRTN